MSAPPTRLAASLKGLTATVLELLQLRLELLSVEAQEEVLRVGGLLVYGAVAVAFLSRLAQVALWPRGQRIGYGGTYAHSDLSNTHLALEALYYSKKLLTDTEFDESKEFDLDWSAAIEFVFSVRRVRR